MNTDILECVPVGAIFTGQLFRVINKNGSISAKKYKIVARYPDRKIVVCVEHNANSKQKCKQSVFDIQTLVYRKLTLTFNYETDNRNIE